MTLRKLLLLMFVLCSAARAEPSLSVAGNAYQGSALFVRVFGDQSEAPPTVTWEGRQWVLDLSDQGWETVLPVGIDTRGVRELTVKLDNGVVFQRALKVAPRDYGRQSITLSASTWPSSSNPCESFSKRTW